MIPVAVLAATGAVGQRFVQLLADHPLFKIGSLVASDRSAGMRYEDATNWILPSNMPEAVRGLPVQSVEEFLASPGACRVAFSALPSGLAETVERQLAGKGLAVFTNTKDLRMASDVPLLIAEVNAHHLDGIVSGEGFVVANGNCSGIILTLALAPLVRFGLQSVHVTTLQGLSGAGYPGVPSLDVVDNVMPFIDGEEDKLETEPQKILGTDFPVYPTCTRVPVREGHTESVHITFEQTVTLDQIKDALLSLEALDLPSAPANPIVLHDDPRRPQPIRDREDQGGMSVHVGRLRLDASGKHLRMVILGHNTLRGAAGQSVLNAELCWSRGLLGDAKA